MRNHGFVLNEKGWRLSKAFDVNPNIDKVNHVLNLNESDNTPSIQTVIETASYYDINDSRADEIANKIISIVEQWHIKARKMGIAMADIQIMEPSFQAH